MSGFFKDKDMSKLIIPVGIPGCGKTTFYNTSD